MLLDVAKYNLDHETDSFHFKSYRTRAKMKPTHQEYDWDNYLFSPRDSKKLKN
jgi:hypothetical protein